MHHRKTGRLIENQHHHDIPSLPQSIGLLKNLRTLDFSGSRIVSLPSTICNLKYLRRLDGARSLLAELPASVGKLKNLQIIDLSHTHIKRLPKTFGKLSALQSLNLSYTELTDFPVSLCSLQSLRLLNLSGVRLTTIPTEGFHLKALENLYLDESTINDIHFIVKGLESLRVLSLSRTSITYLPDALFQLSELEVIDLSETNVFFLPDQLGFMPKLRHLDISWLTIERIPESLALCGLPFFNKSSFYYNQDGINLYNVTIVAKEQSFLLESPELIPGFFTEQIALHECKIVFLGDGGTGQSYTIKRFQNNGRIETKESPYLTHETPGVEITDYHVERGAECFDIHFWDFGGQQIFHSMHKCFMTEQTCYVVTIKSRETKATQRAIYWLRTIETFAPNSPVFLYINCWDDDIDCRYLDENKLLKLFPSIAGVTYCSAKRSEDSVFQERLMNPIISMAANSDGCNMAVNYRWNCVRRTILKENQNYITKKHFQLICKSCEIEGNSTIGLLSFFKNLGICFSYMDESQTGLDDYKVINPVWLTNAIYAIIKEGVTSADEGRINVSRVIQILGNQPAQTNEYSRTMPGIIYSPEECRYIVGVAAKFELCYEINKEKLFFPALCTSNTPFESLPSRDDYPRHIQYRLHYKFVPDSVIHHLMIRCIKKDLAISSSWQRGFVIGSMEEFKAVVSQQDDDETILIEIFTKDNYRANKPFSLLRSEIVSINDKIGIKAEEWIDSGEDSFTVVTLVSAAKKGSVVYGSKTGIECNANDLLGDFYSEWELSGTEVKNGYLLVPIPPREFHKYSPNDTDLRFALYEVYGRVCQYCKDPITNYKEMQVDHILPVKYKAQPCLDSYIAFLVEHGFDIEHPDYVENYFPAHASCNREKGNRVLDISLLYWHTIAAHNSPKIIERIEEYREENILSTKKSPRRKIETEKFKKKGK